jgi:SAM-dependent methyltransferase
MEEHLVKYVHPTGYWYKDTAKYLHLNCEGLKDWIVNFLARDTDSIKYDLGCGTGYYLMELYKAGHKKVIGIEADPCMRYEEFPILSLNLIEPIKFSEKGVVICLEVGEHIPDDYEDVVIDNITKLSDSYIILSWAVEGQHGVGHFNCRNNDYVIRRIEEKGFRYLPEVSEDARQSPNEAVTGYFKNTLMIFEKI